AIDRRRASGDGTCNRLSQRGGWDRSDLRVEHRREGTSKLRRIESGAIARRIAQGVDNHGSDWTEHDGAGARAGGEGLKEELRLERRSEDVGPMELDPVDAWDVLCADEARLVEMDGDLAAREDDATAGNQERRSFTEFEVVPEPMLQARIP